MADNQIDDDWRARLDSHFSGVADRLPDADYLVSGTVVANAPHGIYVDIGCGIPAILDIIHAAPTTDGTPQWTKRHGSTITAKVSTASDTEIALHQMDMESW